jgi:hypothetical protein
MYQLKDLDANEEVRGGFYANELQKAKHSVFKIQILRQRLVRGELQYFVHYIGYGPEHDEWISANQLERRF